MKNPYIAGGDLVSRPVDLDQAQPVQYLSNGGFLVPPKQPVVYRTADKAYLEARQKEADVYESQRAAYNAALEKYKAEVYNPYEQQLGAYNTAAAAYNRDVYEPYKSAYDQYAAAVSAWNEGPRTADYAGPSEPTLKPFEMAVPTAPNPFSMTAPVVPFKEEEVRARQAEAAKRAEADAAGRGVAIAVANDPSRFNLAGLSRPSAISGMSVPGFMKGGPVMAKAPEVLSSKQMLRRLENKVKRYADGGPVYPADFMGPLPPASLRNAPLGGGLTLSGFRIPTESQLSNPIPLSQFANRLISSPPVDGTGQVYPNNFLGPIPPGAKYESEVRKEAPAPAPAPAPKSESRSEPAPAQQPQPEERPAASTAAAALQDLTTAGLTGPVLPPQSPPAPSMDRQADLEYMQTRPEAPVGGQDPDQYFPSGSGGPDSQPVMAAPRPEPAPVPTPRPLPQLERRPLPSYVMPPPPPIISSPETLPDLLRGAGSAPVVARPVGAPVSYVRPSPVYTPVPVPDVPMYGRPRGDVGNIPVGNIPVGNIPVGNIPLPDIPLPGRQQEGARREPRPADQGPAFFNLQPGQVPGTVPLPYTPMNFQAIPTALDLLQQDPSLSPQVLGGMENLGYRTDRFGNVILAPATPMLRTFADGGLAAKTQALNKELLADEEEDDEPILTDPVGTASQMLRELNPQTKMEYAATPKRVSMKRVSKTPMESPSGSAKGMKMEVEELSAMREPKDLGKGRELSRADFEELAREYGLKREAALDTAKGLMRSTFDRPTLEQPSLTRKGLMKRRFAEGGEARSMDLGPYEKTFEYRELPGVSASTKNEEARLAAELMRAHFPDMLQSNRAEVEAGRVPIRGALGVFDSDRNRITMAPEAPTTALYEKDKRFPKSEGYVGERNVPTTEDVLNRFGVLAHEGYHARTTGRGTGFLTRQGWDDVREAMGRDRAKAFIKDLDNVRLPSVQNRDMPNFKRVEEFLATAVPLKRMEEQGFVSERWQKYKAEYDQLLSKYPEMAQVVDLWVRPEDRPNVKFLDRIKERIGFKQGGAVHK